MTKTKTEIWDVFPLNSYEFIQTMMLALRYGFNKTMPWWVTWFPSLSIIGFLLCAVVVVVGMAIASAVIGD